MKKSQLLCKQASPSHGDITTSASNDAPSKITRILGHLLFTGSLNRFEAERLGDHCLHSTISKLANGYGLLFERQLERVPNHWGQPCTVTRYSLPTSEHRRAHNVLAMLGKRGKGKQVAA